MTICPFCQASNKPGAEQCKSCGRHLTTMQCPHCGATNSIQDLYCVSCFSLLHPTAETEKALAASPKVISAEPDQTEEKASEPELTDDQTDKQAMHPAAPIEDDFAQEQLPITSISSTEESSWPQLVPSPDDELGNIDDILDINTRTMEQPDSSAPGYRRPTSRENQLARLWQQIGIKHAPMDEGRHNLSESQEKRTTPRQRFLIYILTFALALLPFLTKGQITDALTTDESASGLLASELAIVPTDQPVLISFDYDASYAGELLPVAKNVLNTLVVRQVPVLTMTTRTTAADMSALVLSSLEADTLSVEWTDLGYTPGQTGLRLLAQSWQAAFPLCTTESTQNATQVSRVLVFSDSLETSLAWIELFGSQVDIPIQMVVTERIYPLLLPYEDSGQLDLLVSGVSATPDEESQIRGSDASLFLLVGVLVLAIWGTWTKSHESVGR